MASSGAQGPHLALVAFAAAWEEQRLTFATPRSSRKFANLKAVPRASILVDDRSNNPADLYRALAVTATGPVRELQGTSRGPARRAYLQRHPQLVGFMDAPSCSLLSLDLEVLEVVQAFQRVTRIAFSL